MTVRSRYAKGRTRQPKGMNKLEASYALYLEAQKRLGHIRDFGYEAITLKIADDCRYTADFFVMAIDDVIEFHETKGPFAREDSIIKLKVAARTFPFRFFLVKRDKQTGDWDKTPY